MLRNKGLKFRFFFSRNEIKIKRLTMRWPGIEPGSTAWKAAMLTTIPPTLCCHGGVEGSYFNGELERRKKKIYNNDE